MNTSFAPDCWAASVMLPKYCWPVVSVSPWIVMEIVLDPWGGTAKLDGETVMLPPVAVVLTANGCATFVTFFMVRVVVSDPGMTSASTDGMFASTRWSGSLASAA
jgi:hypothetical protein